MIPRLLRLYSFELKKVLSWKYFYFSILCAALGCGLAAVLPQHLHSARDAELTGYTLAAIIANYAVNPVALLLSIFFGALVIGQEHQHRTLPNIFSLPVRRHEVVLAKLAVVFTYVFCLTIFIFTCAMLMTYFLHGFEVIDFDSRTQISLANTWHHFLFGALFSIEPVLAAALVAMLLTMLFESAAIAISVSIVGGILLQLFDMFNVTFAFTLTKYIGKPTSLLLNMGEQIYVDWGSELMSMHIVAGAYSFVAIAVMLGLMYRKDIS